MIVTSPADFASTSFDYLIVGGGTAGIVLAARLSEDLDIVVGVIEAGDYLPDMPEINVPGMVGKSLGNPQIDWSFVTVPQPAANDRQIFEPRGKVVGGSSALNFMASGRASAEEYNALETLGISGWNWEELLKYFKKSEKFTKPSAAVVKTYHAGYDYDFHGKDGPLQKSYPHWFNDYHVAFLDTLDKLGVPINTDNGRGYNAGTFTGAFSIDPVTAARSHAGTAYYAPNADRKNLVLLTGAQATRVLLQPGTAGDFQATGIEFTKGSETFTARSKLEVILSAGSFQTPQLLELSGIGLSSVLEKHGIKQVLDLPVGENLQDHPWVPAVFEVSKEVETMDILQDPESLAQQLKIYQEQQGGMLSSMFSAYSFVPLRTLNSPTDYAEWMGRLEKDTSLTDTPAHRKQLSLLKHWFSDTKQAQVEFIQLPGFFSVGPLKPKDGCRFHTLMITLLHPLSRGSVHITSADPTARPDIDPAYFKNPLDLDVMVRSVRFAQKIVATPPYAAVRATPYDPPAEAESDAAVREWCRTRVEPLYHPIGTASMLPKADGGVVDASLKVYGTKNLRVVDASIIPLQLSAHIQSTVYAIAEKAADIIKASRA